MLQLNTLVRFIHSHSPARLSKFKKILARRPKSVPTPALQDENNRGWANNLQGIHFVFFERHKLINKRILCKKQQLY